MARCFVIQPFDRGKFDKRYDDVLAPAIVAANLESYRVDRDPTVGIPIEEIQSGIESAAACLADITTDNPNVWFELGYAIASRREVVLICSEERTSRFPFDVQHRTIINYSTESPRDFEKLRDAITTRLTALLEKETKVDQISRMSSVAAVEGLEQHEIAALVTVAEQVDDPDGGISAYRIREDMERAGFTKIATTLGIRRLVEKRMLFGFQERDIDNTSFTAYRVTDDGMCWLSDNRDKLRMKRESPARVSGDDIPF